MWFVGTSGFASPTLRPGAAGGSASQLLAAYAGRFNAVEMDSTFARFPSEDTVRSWMVSAGESLTFCVYMSRETTHVHRLEQPHTVARSVDTLRALGPQLGCVLFATPPGLKRDVGRLRGCLDRLPGGVRSAWEFRDPSWFEEDVLELLWRRGAAPVIVETMDGVSGGDWMSRARFAYVRCRRERYLARDVIGWGEQLAGVLGSGRDVYAFFRQGPQSFSYATALAELLSA